VDSTEFQQEPAEVDPNHEEPVATVRLTTTSLGRWAQMNGAGRPTAQGQPRAAALAVVDAARIIRRPSARSVPADP
jgi:hypothetical protein